MGEVPTRELDSNAAALGPEDAVLEVLKGGGLSSQKVETGNSWQGGVGME